MSLIGVILKVLEGLKTGLKECNKDRLFLKNMGKVFTLKRKGLYFGHNW